MNVCVKENGQGEKGGEMREDGVKRNCDDREREGKTHAW